MKTIILLMSSLLLISLDSFAKAPNTIDYNGNSAVEIFKIDNTISSMKPVVERNRLWLNLTNAGGAFKQILVGYMTGATNGWDKFYDTVTLDSNPYVDFYSINGGKNLTIQGRALPFDVADEVPLGYKTTISGEFNITINNFDGFFVTQDIFLLDTTTGLIHNLKNGTYSFETAVGVFNDRFVLLYVDNTPLAQSIAEEPVVVEDIVVAEEITVAESIVIEPVVAVPVVSEPVLEELIIAPIIVPAVTIAEVPTPVISEQVIDNDPIIQPSIIDNTLNQNTQITSSSRSLNNKGNSVIVTVKNNQIIVHSVDEVIKEVSVYNMGQTQLFQQHNINANEFVIPNVGTTTQFLIIQTKLKKGNWVSNKIIL